MSKRNRRITLKKFSMALLMGACFAITPAIAEEAKGKPIDLKLDRAPLDLALKSIITVSGMNVVVDSTVQGATTLKLKSVPWEQALDLILKTNDLDKRVFGNTMVISTKQKIAKNFDQGLTKTYPLRFATANDVQGMLTNLLGQSTQGEFKVHVETRLNAVVITTTEDMFARVEDLLKKIDRPVPQVMLDVKIVEVSSNVEKNLGFDWNWGTGSEATAGAAGSGNLWAATEYIKRVPNGGEYTGPNAVQNGADLFAFGDFYRQNYFFNAVFDALERTGDSRILSSPRVIAMNGQAASLNIGQELTFSGGTDQQPQSKNAGTIINITPQINNDGFIVLQLSVEKSSPQLRADGFPTIDTTKVETKLQVQDGEEILVGGIVEENETRSTNKIPFLSNLPFIKHLFIKEQTNPSSKEIVILITPKIVKQAIPTTDFGELVADGGGVPNTTSFNPKPAEPNKPPKDPVFEDPFAGNDFGDGFDDEFGGL